MNPIPATQPSLAQQSLPEIPELSPEQKAKKLAYQNALTLAMNVPYVRETLVENHPKGTDELELRDASEIPGGALNPNLSERKTLTIPQGQPHEHTALYVARQLGFSVGKENFFENHILPQAHESLKQFQNRFAEEFLQQVVTPGYEFEHAFVSSMLNDHGYSI